MPGFQRKRRECEGRRTGEVTRHQKASGRGRRNGFGSRPQRIEIGLERICEFGHCRLVRRGIRVHCLQHGQPGPGDARTLGMTRSRDGLARPVGEILLDQGEIQKPLARIINNVQRQPRRPSRQEGRGPLVFEDEAQTR